MSSLVSWITEIVDGVIALTFPDGSHLGLFQNFSSHGRLLILDEPTVGCDPLLRERIWNLLAQFAERQRITVLITTHYIEEARRSHLVGFMKKGLLMAENTPANLYAHFETQSLERIFYQLCVNDKMRKGSVAPRDANAGKTLKKSQSQLRSARRQSEHEMRQNFYFHQFET